MNIDSGTLAKSSTGSATWVMNKNFTPELMLFFASGKTSGDTENHISLGFWHSTADGSLQASAGKSSETLTKALAHYAGTTLKLGFTVTSVGIGTFTLNHTNVDVNYNIHWIAIAS